MVGELGDVPVQVASCKPRALAEDPQQLRGGTLVQPVALRQFRDFIVHVPIGLAGPSPGDLNDNGAAADLLSRHLLHGILGIPPVVELKVS